MRPLLALLPLLAACGGTPEFAFEVRGPQVALVAEDSALVAFRTRAASTGAIEYGETTAYGTRLDSPLGHEHAFPLTGLAPGTTVHYRILVNGIVEGADHAFRTASPDPPLRFVVFGDCGGGGAAQRDVALRIAESDPDLALLTGDLIYESGREIELDPHYFRPYRELVDRIPFYAALGNHDVIAEGGRPLLDAVHLPGDERTYSFDRGPAHFVALDSNGDLDAQALWLETDLAASAATWTFVFFHHPPYSTSIYGSDLAVRAALVPVFDRHAVDVVFAGHAHVYERTHPLQADAVAAGGTVYVVTGGGGKSLYPVGTSWFTAFSASAYHHVRVDLQGASLDLAAVGLDGSVLDRVTLTK